jgi:hypothetical protein
MAFYLQGVVEGAWAVAIAVGGTLLEVIEQVRMHHVPFAQNQVQAF